MEFIWDDPGAPEGNIAHILSDHRFSDFQAQGGKAAMTKKKAQSMDELLRQVPDTGFTSGKEANADAEYVAHHPGEWKPVILSQRGRPKRGDETGRITNRVRVPESVWELVEEKAKAQHVNLHTALRAAVLEWAAKH